MTSKNITKNNIITSIVSSKDPKDIQISKVLELNPNDTFLVGDLELSKKGLINHHLESINELYEIGVSQIITKVFKIESDIVNLHNPVTEKEKMVDYVHLEISFSDVQIEKPTAINYTSGKEEVLLPNQALQREKTYNSTIRVSAHIKITIHMKNNTTEVREDKLLGFNLGKIPIMVKSRLCHTTDLPKEVLMNLNEDPTDPGGYFIVNGGEWGLESTESILFNKIRIFKNEGYLKELLHAEFISRPGDFYLNSDEFIVRVLSDGQITIEVSRDQLKGKQFPFYVVFRILGWESDKDIWQNIVMNPDAEITPLLSQDIEKAFNATYTFLPKSRTIYNRSALLEHITEEMRSDFSRYELNTEEAKIKLMQIILSKFDNHFLPHMGMDESCRLNKARFLGLVMYKILLTKLGVLESTDRDSFNSKRIHAAGTSYAKIIKTHLNATVIQRIKRAFTAKFKTESPFSINLHAILKSSIHGLEFGKSITQAIVAGNKAQITINKKKRTNRLSSQNLNRKNQLNTFSTLRAITTTSAESAKQSERANEIRRVHMSHLGYICCVHSPEGEKVGINKQLAIFATITGAVRSEPIRNVLLADPDCIPLEKISVLEIAKMNLCNIYINGDWIGVCKNAFEFAKKYRLLRRSLKIATISPTVTIVWDSRENEVYFWTDVGRLIRPMLIVYNNKRDPEFFPNEKYKYNPATKTSNFRQGVALTQKHIDDILARRITIDDLLRERVVEYISAEEQENMYLCASYSQLKDNSRNELREFTHCDIEQSQLGITALISPFSTHNAVVRTIFLTSQSKQTCSVYALNWPHRYDKEGFIQYQSDSPLVKTVSNRYLFPNGNMAIVAIMCYTGYNQEDSLIVSKGAIERGLFDGSKLTFYKTKLESKEEFGTPTLTTEKIRVAKYDKLVNGLVPIGTIVYKDDALIGKIAKVQTTDKGNITIDRSIIYKDIEPAIVHDVVLERNDNDEKIAKVMLRKIREVAVGDKFCLSPCHEVLTATGWVPITDITTDTMIATFNPRHKELQYNRPTSVFSFDHSGEMIHVCDEKVDLLVTPNHKMYVSSEGSNFELVEAQNIKSQVYYKIGADDNFEYNHNAIDNVKGDDLAILFSRHLLAKMTTGNGTKFKYCKILKDVLCKNCVPYSANEDTIELLPSLLCSYFDKLSGIPDFVYKKDKYFCRTIVDYLVQNKVSGFANEIQHLAILAGYSCTIVNNNAKVSTKLEHKVMNSYSVINYTGKVYCVDVLNHIFMVRRNGKCCFTGNSSRSGQKAVCGILLRDEDMPFTEDGIRPTFILNPHCMPSRMTIGQLIESHTSLYCAKKGAQVDGTIFRKVDIDSIANELEDMGLNRYGYHRLYSGITGEYIDTEIFMGPVFYQRLQKFVIDTVYKITQGPSDPLTLNPVEGGKANNGGLRLGEMENSVLVSQGISRVLKEKLYDHSDSYEQYYCRCGKEAIVNLKQSPPIIKCKYCGDSADIFKVPTSWSSKLLRHEMQGMGVGLRVYGEPYLFENNCEDM